MVVHMDETPFRVLEDNGSNSYFWALRTTKEFNQHDITLFHYSDTRSGKVIGEIIGDDYKGTIICDGYGGYSNNRFPKLSFGTCLVHIRREFAELAKIASEFGTSKAKQVLKLMGGVFHTEKNLKYDSEAEKLALRNQLVKPKLDMVYDFITKIENPMGKLKRAINNALRLKDRLYKIFDNAQLPLDNNPVEQSIRPTTLVRKNSLFATSKNGAKTNAMIYTIIQTAKLNNLRIFDYLKYVFDQYTKRVAVKVEDL
ncbi:IS66 family transposase, partial [Limosilactobacillus fermentum]|uniref:IS66 family transposase n=1 Tax=Limosilactobacillus fermentum TaxID=1613 RepID=UPI0021A73B0D